MAPLIVLLAVFASLHVLNKTLLRGRFSTSLMGRISMSAMLLVTGIAHFINTDMMVEIMPDVVPLKREMVYFTGVCELAAALGLLWSKTSRLASVMLIIFFIAVLPANIAGSIKQVDLGGMQYGVFYLLFRIPFQIFLIWWAYYFGLKQNKSV